jgi:hypothetical protein
VTSSHRWILEVEERPPADGERWHARLGTDDVGAFSTAQEAVAWGADAGCPVVVRTLSGYEGATEPFDDDPELWPPDAREWRKIERRYAYELEKVAWLRAHASELTGTPVTAFVLHLPPHFGDVLVEALDQEGAVCGVLRHDEKASPGFGDPEVVIANVLRGLDQAGLRAVLQMLTQERTCQPWERRPERQLHLGGGYMYHATASGNRDSIKKYGLDWSRMGDYLGIAGSDEPELAGIFLDEWDDMSFWHRMARHSTDVWEVDVRGYWLEDGPSGWHVVRRPIPPARLRLIRRDVPAGNLG